MTTFKRIVVDSPWRFVTHSDKGQNRAATYTTMTLADIAALPVSDLAAPDAVLFFWTTNPFLEAAFPIIRAWGFSYSSKIEWTKVSDAGMLQIGTGYRSRACTESLLICKRSDKTFCPAPSDRLPSWFQAPREAHSRKPERAWRYINQYPGNGLELFARRRRSNWLCCGYDIDQRDIRAVMAELIAGQNTHERGNYGPSA